MREHGRAHIFGHIPTPTRGGYVLQQSFDVELPLARDVFERAPKRRFESQRAAPPADRQISRLDMAGPARTDKLQALPPAMAPSIDLIR